MRRILLFRALLRREFGLVWSACVPAIIALAVWCAWVASQFAPDRRPDLVSGLLRRFDLTLLGVLALLSLLRCAQRIADDCRAGWLEPWTTAGGRRATYGIAILISVVAAASAWFVIGAISFAFAVRSLDGTSALLARVHLLLPAGVLLLCCIAAYATVIALAVREAMTAVLLSLFLFAVPFAVAMMHATARGGDGTIPVAVWIWRSSYPPPVTVATSLPAVTHQLAYAIVFTGLVALLSRRYAGRRA